MPEQTSPSALNAKVVKVFQAKCWEPSDNAPRSFSELENKREVQHVRSIHEC
jgi:hypothetical protein